MDRPDEDLPAEHALEPTEDASEGLIEKLIGWLAEQRVDEAAAARSRERWLRQQAEEEGTFRGILVDLGERERTVVVQTGGGRQHRGRIRAVAGDFAVLSTDRSDDVLVRFAAMVSVRPEPRSPLAAGDRTVALDTLLAEALVGLAGERPRVLVVTLEGTAIAGDLRAVGHDVLTVRLDGEDRSLVYVPISAVAEVSLTAR